MSDAIQDTVAGYLCTQCGTCVAVCPVGAIEMRETPGGMLVAHVNEEKCTACGQCRQICPGGGFDLDLPETVDPFRGQVCGAYVGHACDETIRSKGQSGGVVSALLLFLLETRRVDAALVSAMPCDGSLRPKAFLARTREQVLGAQGSKYCPVGANVALGGAAVGDRIAVVGIPCQMHGIHRLQQSHNPLIAGIEYRIGLFCDRTLFYTCIDQMARNAGLNASHIAGLEYRSKARNGWPGEVCFHLDSGESRFYSSSLRTSLKDCFTPPRCRLCFDKTNILSDVSVGDAYGVSDDVKGNSVVIARSKNGLSLLTDASDAGYVAFTETDVELVFEGQAVDTRRRDWIAWMDAWRQIGHKSPIHTGMGCRLAASDDPARVASRRQQLTFNCRIASSATKESAMAIVVRQQWARRLKRLVLRPFARASQGLRKLLRSEGTR